MVGVGKRTESEKMELVHLVFKQIDLHNKAYITYNQIMDKDNWIKFEKQLMLKQSESKILRAHLERYYTETKITQPCLFKIMEFYIKSNY